MVNARLAYRDLFCVPQTAWKKSCGGQQVTCFHSVGKCKASLGKVDVQFFVVGAQKTCEPIDFDACGSRS